MVNSGSFDSDGDRNGKARCTQAGDAATGSQSSDFGDDVDATCKNDCSKSADNDLPSDASAIEPTATKTEINSSMPTEVSSKNIFPTNDEKASLCCSLPLEKIQGALTSCSPPPENLIGDDKLNRTRKLLCLYCDRSFVSANLRQKHVERIHTVKPTRRVSARRQNQLSATTCVHCDKLKSSQHTLNDLFQHLVQEHPTKYFGCLSCEERFLTSAYLVDHNTSKHYIEEKTNIKRHSPASVQIEEIDVDTLHNTDDVPVKVTRSKVRNKFEDPLNIANNSNLQKRKKKSKLKELRSKKISVKTSKIALKRSKRLQAQTKDSDSQKKRREKKLVTVNKLEASSSTKQPEKSKASCVNPYPEFDNFYRVKKITDHSIDNLKISSLTFDDVFDKAFFNRIKCNIEENLLHHIDGKLFKNEESENRISNFEKISTTPQEIQNPTSENYGCELSLNAITPVPSLSLNSHFGEDFESQIEYGSKPSKKKTQTKSDEVHYKYFTRRKYQASILQQKENRDLSKLDMWTQMVVKERQEKILNKKKNAKEIQEYTSGQEYKNKMRREELHRILDRRGPFEDLKEEASKKAAFDKLNSSSDNDISQEVFTDVREVLNEILNKVFEIVKEDDCLPEITNKEIDHREIPAYLDLRRKNSSTQEEIDKSDRIALICSSQETDDYELPTNTVRGKDELIELTGEWARSRMYICAACGGKFSNMKYLIEHRSVYHQNVWVQNYEFVGNQSELYRHLSIPGLGKVGFVEDTIPCKQWKRSGARMCTKCEKTCNSLGELHRHVLECGGDWTWMLARKKCKYRPFGAKSRRKRRGLGSRIPNKRKTEPSEKKNYKKPLEGPRQRPSDADTIQRMLANLPAKRSRRSLISLRDVVFKSRKTKQRNNSPAAKVKCGKAVCKKQKTELSNPNVSQQRTGRSLRSLNKVLSSRILDLNSSLMVKRKLKAIRGRESTRNMVQSKNYNEKTLEENEDKTTYNNSVTLPSQKRKSPKKGTNNSEDSETVANSLNDKKKTLTKKMLSSRLNIKSFFPIKKKNVRSAQKNTTSDYSDTGDNESEINLEPKKNSIYLENSQNMKKNKRGGLKGFVRALSLRKRNSKYEETVEKPLNKNIDPTETTQTNLETVPKKVGRPRTKNVVSSDNLDKDSVKTVPSSEPTNLDENISKKRKLQRSLRSVINKVKKSKTDKTPNKAVEEESAKISSKEILSQPFLEEQTLCKTIIPPEKVVASPEVKENIQGKEEHVLIVADLPDVKENPSIPENIVSETDKAKSSYDIKDETKLNTEQCTTILYEPIIVTGDLTLTQNEVPLLDCDNKVTPVTIDTTLKPKCVPLVSPNIKGKIRKPNRGLNDCIAMLTSKLQQKDEKISSSLESLFSTSSSTSVERTDSRPTSESISPPIRQQKTECILKIPNFRATKSPVVEEETALDLSKKSISSPNLSVSHASELDYMESTINRVNRVIEGVIEHKCKELLTEKLATPKWTSVDDIIQQVVQNSSSTVFHKTVNKKNTFIIRTHVDDTIDYVVNSSSNWFENKKNPIGEKRKQKKIRRRKNSDDNLIKDIIFGKDKLIIAPSSNLHNALENPLIAKIKENESKASKISTSSSINEKIDKDLEKTIRDDLVPEIRNEYVEASISKEQLSIQGPEKSNQITTKDELSSHDETSPQTLDETDMTVRKNELIDGELITELKSNEGCIQDVKSKFGDQNGSNSKDEKLLLSNIPNDKNKCPNVNESLVVKNVENTSIPNDNILQVIQDPKKGKGRGKNRSKKFQKRDQPKEPIIETSIDDCLNIKVIPNVELKTTKINFPTKNCNAYKNRETNKQIELITEDEPIILENKVVEHALKSLSSDSEDEVPLAIIAKQDENEFLKQSLRKKDNVLPLSKSNSESPNLTELQGNNDTIESLGRSTSTSKPLEETISNNEETNSSTPLRVTKDIVENLTTDSLKENIEQTVNKNDNLKKYACKSKANILKTRKTVKSIKRKRRKIVFGSKKLINNKKKLESNLINIIEPVEDKNDPLSPKIEEKNDSNSLLSKTTSGTSDSFKADKLESCNENQFDIPQETAVSNKPISLPNVCTDSVISESKSTERNEPIKIVISSQRTRRKSKSSKKIDKFDNDLFKDFSLVINKKTKRIPPTSIVDDSVCDDVLDKSINTIVKSVEVRSVDDMKTLDESNEPQLDDSVEEMDMEIEDIPINSSIIERDNQQNTTIKPDEEKDKSFFTRDIEPPCTSNKDWETAVTRKSPRKKSITDSIKNLAFSEEQKMEINSEPSTLKVQLKCGGSRRGRKSKTDNTKISCLKEKEPLQKEVVINSNDQTPAHELLSTEPLKSIGEQKLELTYKAKETNSISKDSGQILNEKRTEKEDGGIGCLERPVKEVILDEQENTDREPITSNIESDLPIENILRKKRVLKRNLKRLDNFFKSKETSGDQKVNQIQHQISVTSRRNRKTAYKNKLLETIETPKDGSLSEKHDSGNILISEKTDKIMSKNQEDNKNIDFSVHGNFQNPYDPKQTNNLENVLKESTPEKKASESQQSSDKISEKNTGSSADKTHLDFQNSLFQLLDEENFSESAFEGNNSNTNYGHFVNNSHIAVNKKGSTMSIGTKSVSEEKNDLKFATLDTVEKVLEELTPEKRNTRNSKNIENSSEEKKKMSECQPTLTKIVNEAPSQNSGNTESIDFCDKSAQDFLRKKRWTRKSKNVKQEEDCLESLNHPTVSHIKDKSSDLIDVSNTQALQNLNLNSSKLPDNDSDQYINTPTQPLILNSDKDSESIDNSTVSAEIVKELSNESTNKELCGITKKREKHNLALQSDYINTQFSNITRTSLDKNTSKKTESRKSKNNMKELMNTIGDTRQETVLYSDEDLSSPKKVVMNYGNELISPRKSPRKSKNGTKESIETAKKSTQPILYNNNDDIPSSESSEKVETEGADEPTTTRKSPRKLKNWEKMSKIPVLSEPKIVLGLDNTTSSNTLEMNHNKLTVENNDFCTESTNIFEKPLKESTPKKRGPKKSINFEEVFKESTKLSNMFVPNHTVEEIGGKFLNKHASEKNDFIVESSYIFEKSNESTLKKRSKNTRNSDKGFKENSESSDTIGTYNSEVISTIGNNIEDSGFLERSLEESTNKQDISSCSKADVEQLGTSLKENIKSAETRCDTSLQNNYTTTKNADKIRTEHVSDVTKSVANISERITTKFKSPEIEKGISQNLKNSESNNVPTEISDIPNNEVSDIPNTEISQEFIKKQSMLTAKSKDEIDLPVVTKQLKIRGTCKNFSKAPSLLKNSKQGFKRNNKQLKKMHRNVKLSKNIASIETELVVDKDLASLKAQLNLTTPIKITTEESLRKPKRGRKSKKEQDMDIFSKTKHTISSIDNSLKPHPDADLEIFLDQINEEELKKNLNEPQTDVQLLITENCNDLNQFTDDSSSLSSRRSGKRSIKLMDQVSSKDTYFVPNKLDSKDSKTDKDVEGNENYLGSCFPTQCNINTESVFKPISKLQVSCVNREAEETDNVDEKSKENVISDKAKNVNQNNSLKSNISESKKDLKSNFYVTQEFGKGRRSRKNIDYNEENLEKRAIENQTKINISIKKNQKVQKNLRVNKKSLNDNIANDKEQMVLEHENTKTINDLNAEDPIIDTKIVECEKKDKKSNKFKSIQISAEKGSLGTTIEIDANFEIPVNTDKRQQRNINNSEENLEDHTFKNDKHDSSTFFDLELNDKNCRGDLNAEQVEPSLPRVADFVEMPELIVDLELLDKEYDGLKKSLACGQENIDESCGNFELNENNINVSNSKKTVAKAISSISEAGESEPQPEKETTTKEKRPRKNNNSHKSDVRALELKTRDLNVFDFEDSVPITEDNNEYRKSARTSENIFSEVTEQLKSQLSAVTNTSEKYENSTFKGDPKKNKRSRKNKNYNEEKCENNTEVSKSIELIFTQDLNVLNSKELLRNLEDKTEPIKIQPSKDTENAETSNESHTIMKPNRKLRKNIECDKSLLSIETGINSILFEGTCEVNDSTIFNTEEKNKEKKMLNLSSSENLQITPSLENFKKSKKQVDNQLRITKGKKSKKNKDLMESEQFTLDSGLAPLETDKMLISYDFKESEFNTGLINCSETNNKPELFETNQENMESKIINTNYGEEEKSNNMQDSMDLMVCQMSTTKMSDTCVFPTANTQEIISDKIPIPSDMGSNTVRDNFYSTLRENKTSKIVGSDKNFETSKILQKITKLKSSKKNIMDIDVANILDTDNSAENRRSLRKKKSSSCEKPIKLAAQNEEQRQSTNNLFKNENIENKTPSCDNEVNIASTNNTEQDDLSIVKDNNESLEKLESLTPHYNIVELDNTSSDSNESLPLLDRMTHFLKCLKDKQNDCNNSNSDAFLQSSNSISECVPDYISNSKDSLPIISNSITDEVFRNTDHLGQTFTNKSNHGSLDTVLPLTRSDSMESLVLENRSITSPVNSKNKGKKQKGQTNKFNDLPIYENNDAGQEVVDSSEVSKTEESLSKSSNQEYQLAKITIKNLLLGNLSENSTQKNKNFECESFSDTNLNESNTVELTKSISVSQNINKTFKSAIPSKSKGKKPKGKKSKSVASSQKVFQVFDKTLQKKSDLKLIEQPKGKYPSNKNLSFTALKKVLSKITKPGKINKHKKAEVMFSEIEPLTDIITSSEMDIAPVLDEIDKSLESEDIYDFNEDEIDEELVGMNKNKSNKKRSKIRSRSCPKPEGNHDLLLNNQTLTNVNQQELLPKESPRTSSKRSAKIKALENIHEKVITELNDIAPKPAHNTQLRKSRKRSKSLNVPKVDETVNFNIENESENCNEKSDTTSVVIINNSFSFHEEFSDISANGQHQTNLSRELTDAEIEDDGFGKGSIKSGEKTDIFYNVSTKSDDLNSGLNNTTNYNTNQPEVLESENQMDNIIDGQELRRSRRGSRKVASYNENDLIDPLIDALENTRNRSTKKDRSAEKHSAKKDVSKDLPAEKPKLNSEELFDLLKNSSYENENLNILKPRNSFLENLNEPNSNTGFQDIIDEEFDNILEKPSLILTDTEKLKDIDKIYEFTEESPENTKEVKEFGTSKRKLHTNQQNVTSEFKIKSICNNSVENNTVSLDTVKSKDIEQEKSNYCEICKKTFMRIENLIKHKTTLTHISKLSELEAKEAEEKARLENETKQSVEEPSDSLLKTPDSLKEEINIRDILQQSEKTHTVDTSQNSPSLTNNHPLNLVDIISDVLNKPVLENYNSEKHGFSEITIRGNEKSDIRRYKSLGERKSFESESQLSRIATPLSESYLPSTMSKTTILENQIHLLENIIGNKLENISVNKPENFIDEVSSCSNNSNISAIDNNSCTSNRSAFHLNPENNQTNLHTGFIKPTQYEEISEDSANARIYEDSKLRKTLNRDEELFLECCSLLKSGSEVSNSNYSKNLKKPLDNFKESDEPESLENKKLIQTVEEAHEYSDNSRTPTPLGDTYDDEASNSNTISSNWNLKSEKPLDKNRSISFEEVVNKEEAGISFGEILTKGLKNQFEYMPKSDERSEEKFEENQPQRNLATDDRKDDSDCSTTSKKISTKGARKVFEGLKVSIPTEDLNLDVLNNSLKKSVFKETTSPNENQTTTNSKPRSTRKSKPVKKSQVGSNLLFKVNKKKTSPSINRAALNKKQDVYNFEDTQDNTDVFTKPVFEDVKTTTPDSKDNIAGIDSDNESLGYADSIGADAKSVSSVSSVSAMSSKKPETTPENITKKKYKIMGKIFRNAAKSKMDEIDEELRNIPEIPEIDNLELVQNYVRSCQRIKSPFLPPPPPPPLDEIPKKPKMTEQEMNLLFDQLLGKESVESKPEKQTSKLSLTKTKTDGKTGDIKKKVKLKNRKKNRVNSESSDDEFNINKTAKKRTNKKNSQEDSGINLELELKECIGVASRKSQRKCTSGKQNVLVEYWSSDEEAFEAMLNNQKAQTKKDEERKKIEQKKEKDPVKESQSETPMVPIEKPVKRKQIKRKPQPSKKLKVTNNQDSENGGAFNRRKRAAVNPLYHWSSSSEDESQSLIEVKPIREEDDEEDRPIQHGWIVGDSPKKLVTMLALTKGKKNDIDSVKEQGKRRTSNTVS